MIVYIESNFVLELALQQEDFQSCQAILEFAANHRIQLVIPSFCIGEPYETLVRRATERRKLNDAIGNEIRQISRSKDYTNLSQTALPFTKVLIQSNEKEKKALDSTLLKISKHAEIIPLDRNILKSALDNQSEIGLKIPDSIVYASVYTHARSKSTGMMKCFLNSNSKDFLDPRIENELQSYGCKVIVKFQNGLSYITSQIEKKHGH